MADEKTVIEGKGGGKRGTSYGSTLWKEDIDGATRQTVRSGRANTLYDNEKAKIADWGSHASRGLYSVFSNLSGQEARDRDLLKSRLWKGVPQLSQEQMNAFEAAYTGHTFIFVVDVPKFMTSGIYQNTNMHQLMKNFRSIMERASTQFQGASDITLEFDEQNDGNGRKLSHPIRTTKEQQDIQFTLHEFAALPVKNALEAWVTGIYDYRSEHGHYHGNLGIPGGWCLANHTMSVLVVQVDPSWVEIQDAALYFNMMPMSVPFDHFNWQKGEHNIIQDLAITFKCNEERSPAVMYAAEKYMNARILSFAATSVFNSRQFVANTFDAGTPGTPGSGIGAGFDAQNGGDDNIMDSYQYNISTTGTTENTTAFTSSDIKNEGAKYLITDNTAFSDKNEPDLFIKESATNTNQATNNN